MKMDTNILFSIITVGSAIFALYQTHKQIKISNKHKLFDRRLNNFLIIKGLVELYEESKQLMKERDYNQAIDVIILFHGLTNNIFLKDIGKIIDDVLNENLRQKFLVKLEDIKNISVENEFIFTKKISNPIKNFVYEYQELLRTIYKYQIIFDKIMKENRNNPKPFVEWQKEYGEKNYRENLYESYKKMEILYKKLMAKKSIELMKGQIKL